MTERNELINDIQKLKAERNRVLKQIKDAERWESAACDSYNALTEHSGHIPFLYSSIHSNLYS
ncbi:hypothetical protein [Streptococcus anginosus]|uniref:hypothetical protein n=1 Tax=Streptococcus anginosus TaxID=1328 RepID=UPI003081BD8A|nr:hypothetical protein LPZ00_002004 [Streptococcus anginosus]